MSDLMLAIAAMSANPGVIDVNTLLAEMVDLPALSRRSPVAYRTEQASSYDRKSVAPDQPDWFANDDWGQYIREETNGGRKEHVMADVKGPGAVVRIWSANPTGTIRFYFDGQSKPGLTANLKDLLSGQVSPFKAPFAYEASKGYDLYFPIPFHSGVKITVDENPAGADHLYYHVNYRLYAAGTQVNTFHQEAVNMTLLSQVAAQLENGAGASGEVHREELRIPAGSAKELAINTPVDSAITQLRFQPKLSGATTWSDPSAVQNLLRNLVLEIEFDGEKCVDVPISDFFANVPSVQPYRSYPMEVQPDGTSICRFTMPFRRSAVIRLRNTGKSDADVSIQASVVPNTFDNGTYLFHAQWKPEISSSRPMRDMEFLNVSGEGRLVGIAHANRNPSPIWWGEGDEKVYVDGETFPSTFGTGTEDYFGYAWCSPLPFQKPYHGQPYVQGPENFGFSCQHRWHIFDSIPFSRSLRFDLELWHWREVDYKAWATTYWYARPGTTSPLAVDPAQLPLEEIIAPRVAGVIEGESMLVSATGGKTEVQDGYEECSGFQQLWWHGAAIGDKLTLHLEVPEAGQYRLSGHFCTNNDYGVHTLSFNGTELKSIDFYSPDLKWRSEELGVVTCRKGENTLEVLVRQPNDAAKQDGRMFGVDYLKLEKV